LTAADENDAASVPPDELGWVAGIRTVDVGGEERHPIDTRRLAAWRSPVQPVQCGAATMANMAPVAGDFIFIEPGVPHEVFNVSDTEPVVAVVARSDASEWEHIIPFERPSARHADSVE
jgi:hypothetical protein